MIMEREGIGLGHSGRVPGRMGGRVGVEGGGISPCVHEDDAGRVWARDRCRTVDNGSIESGLESSYMERFDAGRNAIICSRGKGNVSGTIPRGESATLLPPEQGWNAEEKRPANRPPQTSQGQKRLARG